MVTLFLVSFVILSVVLLILVSRPIILEWMKMCENKKILKIQELQNERIKNYAEQLNTQNTKLNDLNEKLGEYKNLVCSDKNKQEAILKYLIEESKDENKKQGYMIELKNLFIEEKAEQTEQS